MKSLVAFFKVIAVVLTTILLYSIYMIGYVVKQIFRRPANNWLNSILKFWGQTCSKILSIDVKIVGKKPDPPFFLVSNHLSYIDIIVLFSALDTTFVAKSEVAQWPVIGSIAKSIGIVFIDRKKKMDIKRANKEISSIVSDRRGLTLFPEGTTSPGATVLRFKPSLLQYPAQSKLGVHYCSLHYKLPFSDNSAHDTVSWWGNVSLHNHLFNLAKEKLIIATITFGNRVLYDEDRKILAEKLHNKVSSLFKPLCKEDDTTYKVMQF